MESIFGQSTSAGAISPSAGCGIDRLTVEETLGLPSSNEGQSGLSHVDGIGKAKMVDVSSKDDGKRIAAASCRVLLGQHAFSLVAANRIAKGDVLNVAKIAGIQGAKRTSDLVPLCHNISLDRVDVSLALNEDDYSVEIVGEVAATAKTGVEMEAMTAAAVAGLTVYDMCKAAAKDIRITDVRLEWKIGGKSGGWSRKQ
ncbi:hypothetical protein KSP39_PZI001761 [Platanthera zijinensis]|uniref:cyclic pyranopterin monophosphate synthase n=1 Tax=Platanthera zijinensis TaxID=2320716 RepID=A0AAP0GE55_9ASPA